MTTIEPAIFHKYLHKVFIFAQMAQATRKDVKNSMNRREKKGSEKRQEIIIERVRPNRKKSDENHTELSCANR